MLYFITGGERSGKSTYGEKLALSLSNSPVYLATSRVWDTNFKQRIDHHKNTRSEAFINREEEKYIATAIFENEVVLIDCITLWLTNYFTDLNNNAEACLAMAKAEIDKVVSINATVIFISNEIGMGVHASTPEGRKFTELQGWVNQYIAQKATKATLLISGLPLHLKE